MMKGRKIEENAIIVGYKPIPLDGGYGWVVVFGAFLIHVFADGFVYSFGTIVESLIREFHSTKAEVSTVLSVLTGVMLVTGPIASAICSRIGCRLTVMSGAIIACLSCVASWQATSVSYLILSIGVAMGFGFGLMYCPAIIIVTMYFERYRSLATGVTVCGAGAGTFIFPFLISDLITQSSWRTVFLIYAGIVLLGVPCGMMFRPIQREPIYASVAGKRVDGESELDEEEENPENAGRLTRFLRSMHLSLFLSPVFALFAISNFLTSIGFNAPPMLMPLNAMMTWKLSDKDASTTVSAYGLANFLGRIAFGLVCDWRPPISWARDCARNRLVIYVVTLLMCGLATCFVFAIGSLTVYTAYCFFFGFVISSFVCLASVILVDLVGVDRLTGAFGLLLFVQGVATFIGPPASGFLVDWTHKYDWAFAFCGICLFVSAVILLPILALQHRTKLPTGNTSTDKLTMP